MLSRQILALFQQTRYFLRAIGFELLNTLLRRWTATESPKPVFRHSRWIALSRCAIHIFPCSVFLFLIPLNFSAMYLGPGFSFRQSNEFFLVLFQIAAKILEIACVASLTTVVLHVLRHHLMRDGVPLGFVGSGIFFSQASFFWSPETFVGALYCVKSWKRLALLIVILVTGLLALLIAPAAAVLIQPRLQHVPAGGTEYFLPATPDQLWPSEVNGSDELSECFGRYESQNILCASAGYESLRNYFTNFNSSFSTKYSVSPIVIQSLAGKVSRLVNGGIVYAPETSISQPNAITAILQDLLMADWYNQTQHWSGKRFSAGREYRYALERLSSVVTTSPTVHTRCAPAQNVSAGQFEVSFPVKLWTTPLLTPSERGSLEWEDALKPFNVTISNDSVSDALQSEWISLPTDRFGPVSGGLLLRYPGKTFRAVVGCSISASWFSGEVTSDTTSNEAAWSITESSKAFASIRNDLNASSTEAYKYRRLINIHEDWVRTLAPPTSGENCNNQTKGLSTLGRLFSDVGLTTVFDDMRAQGQSIYDTSTGTCVLQRADPVETDVDRWNRSECDNGSKHMLLEHLLASIFANGLSRYGSRYAFELSTILQSPKNPFRWQWMTPPKASNYFASLLSNNRHRNAVLPPPPESHYVGLRMRVVVVGYAWYASGFSDYLATAVVITYMLVATAHTVWVLTKGITSSSWDTVTELLALALRSPVPDKLRGSGAGIERLGTYRLVTRLRALREEEEAGEVRLVLLVDGVEEGGFVEREKEGEGTPRVGYERVKVDEEYS